MNTAAEEGGPAAGAAGAAGAADALQGRCSVRFMVTATQTGMTACELLAKQSGLSKGRIKDAMTKGAAWLVRGKSRKRLRRATTAPKAGEGLELHYDQELLSRTPPPPRCLHDALRYSIWLKPAGLLAQGTDFGDHCSLLRLVELHFQGKRQVLPVHRLDREASGLMLVAHDRQAAATLSSLLQAGKIDKRYRITVRGLPEPSQGSIEFPLDGKPALSRYTVLAHDQEADSSQVEVTLATGRLHQIRRHFAMLGHPVLGDPRYGTGNKNASGLALLAASLAFVCPFSGQPVRVDLAAD
ncbi:MAG: RluA family pseudouridine synthase [Thermodesulfobacteriota bacterium]